MRITASKSGSLIDECAYAFRDGLERVYEPSGPAAATGTLLHTLAEHFVKNVNVEPFKPWVKDADTEKAARMFDQLTRWWGTWEHSDLDWQTEVPFALSLTTGAARVIPSRHQRDYSDARPDEVTGTADLVVVMPDHVKVYDWKTTSRPDLTESAATNKQLATLGIAASRVYERDAAEVGLIFVNEFACTVDVATIDVLTMDMHEERLREAVASIPTSKPRPGDWCRWCSHRAACDAAPTKLRNFKRKAA